MISSDELRETDDVDENDDWVAEFSKLAPSVRAALRRPAQLLIVDDEVKPMTTEDWHGVRDYFEEREAGRETDDVATDDMDRFQDADGHDYRVTVDYTAPTTLEARMLADVIRDCVRRHEVRVNCPACRGARYIKTPISAVVAYTDMARNLQTRRCTACKDGTVVENPAVVTFEALREVGSEALAPRYFHPSERADQDRRLMESVRAHPAGGTQ